MRPKFTALEAKNRFGELLDAAQREPVTIEKHGRPVAVLMSRADYEEYEVIKLKLLTLEIDKGWDDSKAGRALDSKEVFAELRAKRAR